MEEWDDDEIFVYTGGDQFVPDDVRRVKIDKSVTIIRERAFDGRMHLIYVEFHDGIEIIREAAFHCCRSLRSVKLMGVKVIEMRAFQSCVGLTDIEFGDKLETLGTSAFLNCKSLTNITMPSARSIGRWAFNNCVQLTDLEVGEELETIQEGAFYNCIRLRHIAMPLNCMIGIEVFSNCSNLTAVDLVGGIHNTAASLHLESWRSEMKDEINRINQTLPTFPDQKTDTIQQWIRSVIRRLDHYKAEHVRLLKEATTLLELALWKAKIDEKEEKGYVKGMKAKRVKLDSQSERNERRITSGASIVIKNVLPFLELK
eukprot:scaffold4390_cov71-Skeletonema_dohrnii-CCMP3373.AAC.5